MPRLPVGTVTFLFTDIEGSTRLVQDLGSRYRPALEMHHGALRRAVDAHRGAVVSTEGDAFFAVFSSAIDGLEATVDAQRELAAIEWPDGSPMRVRMGLHTGDGELGGDNYVGVDVNRAARITSAGHGGQVLLSDATRALVDAAMPAGVLLRDLGRHRLRDLRTPEHLYQLVIDGLPADFPVLRTLDAVVGNVVEPPTSLVGREQELDEAAALLAGTRLLTLTGPGGTGKTRLAIELGSRARSTYVDGVFFISLETIAERSLVAGAIAHSMGLRSPVESDPEDVLVDQLAERQALLILDNFEQVVAAAPLVTRLLGGAARLRILVTSRVPLHVSGEQEYAVPPLGVPEVGRSDVGVLSRVASVALFVDRARRVQPAFQLTDMNATAVAAICRRLDGLPLAIELAAARVKMLAPDAIVARLEHALSLLGGGSVDLPARQRTLRAAIDWSYQLLDPVDQALFARLTVFSGGWTIEAAEDVTATDDVSAPAVLDGLSRLVEQSLVRPVTAVPAEEPRFEMLQVIRAYGAERLAESPEAAIIGRRHAAWTLALAEVAEPVLTGGMDLGWLDRLSREHDNVRAALRWCADEPEREWGLRLATAVWRFWQQRGHIREGRTWFDRLLPPEPERSGIDPGVLAAAYTAVGGLAYWQNRIDEADAQYRKALELDLAHGRSDRTGDDLYNLAFVDMVRGDLDAARTRFRESGDLFAAAGQTARLGDTVSARGAVEMRAGNPAEARDLLEEARRLNLAAGNRRRATDNAMVLGNIGYGLGEVPTARRWLLTALDESIEMGDVARMPNLAEIGMAAALAEGRPRDALSLAAAAARRRATLGGGAPNFAADVDVMVERARAELAEREGPEAIEDAWTKGEALDDVGLVSLLRGPEATEPGA